MLLCSQEDTMASNVQAMKFNEALSKERDDLKTQYEETSNYLLEVEERCQAAQNICLQLLQHLKARDLENEHLHRIIHEAKHQLVEEPFIYKPHK
jgi:hypothetical protein